VGVNQKRMRLGRILFFFEQSKKVFLTWGHNEGQEFFLYESPKILHPLAWSGKVCALLAPMPEWRNRQTQGT
jgi:hypothetical protein